MDLNTTKLINNQQQQQQQEEYENEMREARNKETNESKLTTLKELQAKADSLKKEIANFSIAAFMIAMLFAGFKDLLDMFSVELFSWLDWIIDLGFAAVLFFALGKGSLKKIREIRLTVVITGATEAIPIIGALPCWTASLFLLYIKTKQKNSATSLELENLQKKIAKLESEIT